MNGKQKVCLSGSQEAQQHRTGSETQIQPDAAPREGEGDPQGGGEDDPQGGG